VSQAGEKVEHNYKYPGEYNVVLNGSCGDLHSVSRTVIKVTTSNISIIKKADGAVEVFNQGKYEVNLYGLKLQSEGFVYAFPIDTIISAGKSVVFPAEYLKIPSLNSPIILADLSGKTLAQTNQSVAVVSPEKSVSIAELQKFVAEYKKLTSPSISLLADRTVTNIIGPTANISASIPLSASVATAVISTSSSSDLNIATSSQTSTEAPKRGFWSKLFHPIRTIQETFYR